MTYVLVCKCGCNDFEYFGPRDTGYPGERYVCKSCFKAYGTPLENEVVEQLKAIDMSE